MIGRNTVLVLFLSFLTAQAVKAETPTAIHQVIDLMYNSATPGLIARKVYSDDGGVQIVFVANFVRYTMVHRNQNNGGQNFSVWVRPDGTQGQNDLVSFTDEDADGSVDLWVEKHKVGHSPTDGSLSDENSYWQHQYEKAVFEALKALRK